MAYSDNIISLRVLANSINSGVNPPVLKRIYQFFLSALFHGTFLDFSSKSERIFMPTGSFQYLHSPNIRFFPSGSIAAIGKTKTLTSNRTVPLNDAAIEAIKELRAENYFGEDSPLICDENGNFTKPVNFRKRFYRILKDAGIETKGLHSLRHTFASHLVNGVKQSDGTIKALSPKQVADIPGHTTSQITEMYYVKKVRLSSQVQHFC